MGLSGWVWIDILSDEARQVCSFLEDFEFHSVASGKIQTHVARKPVVNCVIVKGTNHVNKIIC